MIRNNSIFDKSGVFEKYSTNTEKILEILEKFGFTKKESKIYMFLGKHGAKTASEVNTELNMPRGETYRILNDLKAKGMLQVSYKSPTVFSIIPLENVSKRLLIEEEKRLRNFQENKKTLLKLWQEVPNFESKNIDSNGFFQTLTGFTQINNQLKEMIKNSKKEFLLLGSYKEFTKFHYDEIFEELNKLKLEQKILGINSAKLKKLLKEIPQEDIIIISNKEQNDQCFAISDRQKIIFFTKETKDNKPIAIFTNSKSISESFSLLFDLMCARYGNPKEIKKSEFKLNELKQEMLIADEINLFLKEKTDKSK